MSKKHQVGSRALQPAMDAPVTLRAVPLGANLVSLEIGIDYQRVPVPERFYYADYCDVQRARSGFGLLFGKLITGTSKLRTKVEIDFPEEMFVRQLWASSRDFHETVRMAAEKMQFAPVNNLEDTDKVQTFRSNNVFMATWGEEAVIDFYYLSPRDVHISNQQNRSSTGLEPVIRVLMATPLMFEFLEKCGHYVDSPSAPKFPKVEAI